MAISKERGIGVTIEWKLRRLVEGRKRCSVRKGQDTSYEESQQPNLSPGHLQGSAVHSPELCVCKAAEEQII